jgi:hypothetical protein
MGAVTACIGLVKTWWIAKSQSIAMKLARPALHIRCEIYGYLKFEVRKGTPTDE